MNLASLLKQHPNHSLARKAKTKQNTHKRNGVLYPITPVQTEKDYTVITTLDQLMDCFDKCREHNLCSFDWETGPSEEEEDRWEAELSDLMDTRDVCEEELKLATSPSAIKAANKVLKDFDKEIDEKEDYFKLAPLDPHRAKICTCSISYKPNQACVVFLQHDTGSQHFLSHLTRAEALAIFLKQFEEHILSCRMIEKIAYNLSFETKMLLKYGVYVQKPVVDPFIMIVRVLQVINTPNHLDMKAPAKGKGLKQMTLKYLGVKMSNFTTVVEDSGHSFFSEMSTDDPTATLYSAEDSDYSLQLYLYFKYLAEQITIERKVVDSRQHRSEILNEDRKVIKVEVEEELLYDKPFANYYEWLHEIEMPFARVIGQMEYHGFTWNNEKAEEVEQLAVTAMNKAVNKIKEIGKQAYIIMKEQCNNDAAIMMGYDFLLDINPGKTGKVEAVRELLFNVLGCPTPNLSDKTGKANMDHNSILDMKFMVTNNLTDLNDEIYVDIDINDSKYDESDRKRYAEIQTGNPYPHKELILELLTVIEDVQKFGVLLSSHIYGRKKFVNPVTNRIHARFTQWTETSRLNSSTPNGQNVPRKDTDPFLIRNIYQAAKDKVLLLIDYSGFELRLMAWASRDENMLDIFTNNGDMHARTAATLTGKKECDITKEERISAKSGNFGIGYGGTKYALQRTYKKFGVRHSLEFCDKVVDAVKLTYPGIVIWQKECAILAKHRGYAETIFGYRRMLPNINSMNRQLKMADERKASNTPIQGSAADIMKKSQNAIYDLIAKDTYRKRFFKEDNMFNHDKVNQIQQFHDELVLEVDNDPELIKYVQKTVQTIMEEDPIPYFPVKIAVDTEIAVKGWGDKEPFNKWIEKQETTND